MKKLIAIIAILMTFAGSTTLAQEASNLDELLDMVKQGRVNEAKEHRERESTFNAQKSQQAKLLQQAKAQEASEERRSAQLENSFERNEIRTAELTETLNKRLGSLKELFGVLQQAAGDARGNFDSSLVSVQYPDRTPFLDELVAKMGKSSKLASIDEIETLWFEIQREMTETGKVSKFSTTVVTADGKEEQRDVVRVGAFNIVSDGAYLKYTPETKKVSELVRQPQSRFVGTTSDIVNANEGLVRFGLDPARGSILGLLVNAPSLRERVDQGGLIGYLILALGAIGMLIALERLLSLTITGGKVRSQLKNNTASPKNPLGRVLIVYDKIKTLDREALELKMGEAIMKETPALMRGVLFLKITAVVAPLMGLLGTVTGMINTFQAITLFGTGDPKLMAGGISQALVTTVLGLVVAIPMLLMHTLVNGRSRGIIHVLEEQSTGIIAEHVEQESE